MVTETTGADQTPTFNTPTFNTPTFNTAAYAQSYPTFGAIATGPGCPVHIRRVPGSHHQDGMLPWPYVWLGVDGEAALRASFADLITISGVLAPADSNPWGETSSVRRFKDHFAFDPGRRELQLTAKTRSNIAKGRRRWTSHHADDLDAWREFARLYADLVERRSLRGTAFDLPADHFTGLRDVPGMRLVGAHDGTSWGSMAITAAGPDGTHLLHIVNSDDGLHSNASYALMDELIGRAERDGTVLALGGLPAGDTGGMAIFKTRWSNTTRPSWLVTMVIRPSEYADLTRGIEQPTFFPAYRAGW